MAGKQAQREALNVKMGQPNFWDNPEKAQEIIGGLKPLNGLLKPYEELHSQAENIQALAEMSEEDVSFDAELASELNAIEKALGAFEMRAMLSGSLDGSRRRRFVDSLRQ